MPNATSLLFAYLIVLGLELTRYVGLSPRGKVWRARTLVGVTGVAILVHTLYLLDRMFLSASATQSWRLISSWHDWGILAAWALAIAYIVLLLRRSESWIGIFVLPMVLILLGAATLVPNQTIATASSASLWRMVHGIAMTLGTMLVSLGFAMAIMYLMQEWRLKSKLPNQGVFRLPSLEYLQSIGSTCLILSAASIGLGVISGVIMNVADSRAVDWSDRGILFSTALFTWLGIASAVQWHFAKLGRGHITAWMNILSFIIVGIALYLVVSAPHGQGNSNPNDSPSPPTELRSNGGAR